MKSFYTTEGPTITLIHLKAHLSYFPQYQFIKMKTNINSLISPQVVFSVNTHTAAAWQVWPVKQFSYIHECGNVITGEKEIVHKYIDEWGYIK